ncbi:MAG: S9 family peptidase [Acidobacteriota bacterium]|nr:MAG: S9 family peptidase [Acidobacteriota bacterium]
MLQLRYNNRVHGSLLKVGTLSCLFLIFQCCSPAPEETPSHPTTRQDNVREIIHGVEIVDPFRWLEDRNNPETGDWIRAQNEYTHQLLDNLPYLGRIQSRYAELSRIDQISVPTERNGRYFLWKKRAEDDLWVLYKREGLRGKDEVLIDPHQFSPDHTTNISQEDISADGMLLVYGVRTGGEDETELRVLNVETGEDLPDRLPRALYRGVSLKKDNSGFYYNFQRRDVGIRIRYHAIGTDPSEDVEIFGEGYGPDKWINGTVSDDGRSLLISVHHGWGRNEVYVKEIGTDKPITAVVNDIDAHFYPEIVGGTIIMQTDWKAPSNRILAVDLEDPARQKWREVVPASSDTIQSYSLVGGKLFVHYLHDVTSRIKIFSADGEPEGEMPLPGLGTATGPHGHWDSEEAFVTFSTFLQSGATYLYDTSKGTMELWAQDSVPFNPDPFEVKQVWYPSKDGTRVPMFVVHKKGLELNGEHPALLYGYGGFNVSLTPRFSTMTAIWLESGGVYALANIRGGGEFGEEWHRAGMLEKKQNVFDDFIAAAEWLINSKYTNPSRLAIRGGSNGGLLVGAALTQRPDLYQAVLCEFPDLDMIGYYRFDNNNPPALLEYGNASEPEQFKFLYAYSPYQKVKPGTDYPAVMLTTGDNDTRVPPLQARKMTARLQMATSSERPILLRYDTMAGHAGGKPLSKQIEDYSLELAFLFWQVGMD